MSELLSGAFLEAAAWVALVVAIFILLAGAPIMAKFWLKPPPPKAPVETAPTPAPGQTDSTNP